MDFDAASRVAYDGMDLENNKGTVETEDASFSVRFAIKTNIIATYAHKIAYFSILFTLHYSSYKRIK